MLVYEFSQMRLLLLNSSLIIHKTNSLGSQVSVCTFLCIYVLMPLEYNLTIRFGVKPLEFPCICYGRAMYTHSYVHIGFSKYETVYCKFPNRMI